MKHSDTGITAFKNVEAPNFQRKREVPPLGLGATALLNVIGFAEKTVGGAMDLAERAKDWGGSTRISMAERRCD